MYIIGITGTLGAGKGTIVEYLVNEKGFIHFSVRSFLIEEIEKRGLIVNRDSMTLVANELRAQYSPSYIIDRLYEKAVDSDKNCVIESIRTPGEVYSLREKPYFKLFAVDADPEVRYQRIVKRASETDSISYETFLDNEKREMSSTDPNKQNIGKCIELADYTFHNDKTIQKLKAEVESVLQEIGL